MQAGVGKVIVYCCNNFPLPRTKESFRDQREDQGVLWSAVAGVVDDGAHDFYNALATYFAFHKAAPAVMPLEIAECKPLCCDIRTPLAKYLVISN